MIAIAGITFEIWLLFVLTGFVTAATPGPGNLLVISYSIRYEKGEAFLLILGILAGLFTLSTVAITGVGALLAKSEMLFRWVQLAGAAYILYLGISLFRTPSIPNQSEPGSSKSGRFRFFFDGIVVAVANPKSIAFFAALFPPFINTKGHVGIQYVILISTHLLVTFLVLSFYCLSTRKLSSRLQTYGGMFNKIAGVLLIALALYFITTGLYLPE